MIRAERSVPDARNLGETVHYSSSWKLPAFALALMLMGGTVPALADDSAAAAAAPVVTAAAGGAGVSEVTIAPMPDAAVPGAYCIAGATAAMIAVFAAGPTEGIMILSGAMHLPSSTAVMFIPLMSILGGGACAIGAAAQPAISWAIEQSDNIGAQVSAAGQSVFSSGSSAPVSGAAGAEAANKEKETAVRALTEGETQSVGCVAGALAGFGAAMATSPMEVAMLSSGANTVVSTTPILALGLIGTIVASGCAIGTYAILPIQAFFNNFSAIGDSVVSGLGHIGSMASDGASRTLALVRGSPAALEVADGTASR